MVFYYSNRKVANTTKYEQLLASGSDEAWTGFIDCTQGLPNSLYAL